MDDIGVALYGGLIDLVGHWGMGLIATWFALRTVANCITMVVGQNLHD